MPECFIEFKTFQKRIPMKQILVILLFVFSIGKSLGQQSVDIGLFGGTGTYFGDMTHVELSKSLNPAYGGFFRLNFNPRYSLRINMINGTIGAEGNIVSKDWSFDKNVLDISMMFEFNYMKYIVGDKETGWSTFLFGGIGMQTYKYVDSSIEWKPPFLSDQKFGSEIKPVIPFGMGFKFDLGKRVGIGFEGGLRKSFSDKLDNIDDPFSYEREDDEIVKFADKYHNNDWTAYVGVHLVYKLIYGNRVWTLSTPRSRILDWGIWNKDRKE